MACAAPR